MYNEFMKEINRHIGRIQNERAFLIKSLEKLELNNGFNDSNKSKMKSIQLGLNVVNNKISNLASMKSGSSIKILEEKFKQSNKENSNLITAEEVIREHLENIS